MSRHTPGPWFISKKGGPFASNPGQSAANARLIAAASDLLAAQEPEGTGPDFLEWVADRLVHVHGEPEHADFVIALRRRASKARAAIAKAKGVSS